MSYDAIKTKKTKASKLRKNKPTFGGKADLTCFINQ